MNSLHLEWLTQFYDSKVLCTLSDTALQHLYNHTQPRKVPINEVGLLTDDYLVNSPDGYVKVHEWRNKNSKMCVKVVTKSGRDIICSVDHIFEMESDRWKYAAGLLPNDNLVTETGLDAVVSARLIGTREVYDLHINHSNHRYYTNGISSHNSGSGKSLVMMNIALNWLSQGMSGVYITLELSEELTSLRTDAMLTSMSTKDIRKNLDETELRVKISGKKMGKYRVKELPAQSNVNAIRSYIKEVQIQTGIKIDFVMIDYLDLIMPVSIKVNPNDQFIKDKYVSEELRNLAKELGVLMITASQLNRSAVEEIEFDHSHIAGGISKINTADYVFGIFTSRSMKERGKYQIQCMKSRSSTGVGQKIDLDYNMETMRITDDNPDEDTPQQRSPNQILSQIKTTSQVGATNQSGHETDEPVTKHVVADVKSAQLKSLLNSLKK